MPSEICQNLWNKEKKKELKKHSIYLLEKDEGETGGEKGGDRGFEFFVFIDTRGNKMRPPFLKELLKVVQNGEKCKEFAVPDHKNELRKWLGANSDDDPMLTPLYWLKIAMERYPYRLFVVIDPGEWKNSESGKTPIDDDRMHNFLRKRICWIDKKDFYMDSQHLEKFKTWLAGVWIGHIFRNIREYRDINSIFIRPHGMDYHETSYIPSTLPFDRDLKPKSSYNSILYDLNAPVNGFRTVTDKMSFPIFLFSRHGDLFEYETKKSKKWEINGEFLKFKNKIIYSENLSGSLSFFSQFLTSLEKFEEIKSEFFLLKMIEQSLFRIGIADERFQEWWGKLDTKGSGSIFQSRLTALYWGDENQYGQNKFPEHKVYCCLKTGNSFEWGSGTGEGFEDLWSKEQRGIDVLLIHQGILDKWRETKTQSELTKNILNLKDHFPFVVITSGRGKPENLPFGTKFLPYSGIEMCMLGGYFEKLTLFRQLMSLTSGD